MKGFLLANILTKIKINLDKNLTEKGAKSLIKFIDAQPNLEQEVGESYRIKENTFTLIL